MPEAAAGEEAVNLAEDAKRFWKSHFSGLGKGTRAKVRDRIPHRPRRIRMPDVHIPEEYGPVVGGEPRPSFLGQLGGEVLGGASALGDAVLHIPEFANRHRKLLMLGAAGVATYHAHPLKNFNHTLGDMVHDNPDYYSGIGRVAVRGAVMGGLGEVGTGSFESSTQPGISSLTHEQLENYYRGPNPNPDGAIVFGLWNSRLKG